MKDLNIFSEKKTNLGLFNLKSVFNSHIYLKGCHVEDSYILLKMLKIKYMLIERDFKAPNLDYKKRLYYKKYE